MLRVPIRVYNHVSGQFSLLRLPKFLCLIARFPTWFNSLFITMVSL